MRDYVTNSSSSSLLVILQAAGKVLTRSSCEAAVDTDMALCHLPQSAWGSFRNLGSRLEAVDEIWLYQPPLILTASRGDSLVQSFGFHVGLHCISKARETSALPSP